MVNDTMADTVVDTPVDRKAALQNCKIEVNKLTISYAGKAALSDVSLKIYG